jgi:hypothetical protein
LVAIAHYANHTTKNVTQSVTWSSSSGNIAGVGNGSGSKGLVNGIGAGGTVVTAALRKVSASTKVTVTDATLTSITIIPSSPTMGNRTTLQLTAIGNFSDGTTQDLTASVSWSSSSTATAQVGDTSGGLKVW